MILARVDKNVDVACRRYRAQPETLGHILGLCRYTKALRIKRHDEVKSSITEKQRRDNDDFIETTLRVGGGLLKPDLVIKNGKRVLVVDVIVRNENMDYLSKAEKGKVDKYLPCLSYLKEKFKVRGGDVLHVVLGSRGAITPNTEKVLQRMGIADRDIKTIVVNVLRSSIEMRNIFLDG